MKRFLMAAVMMFPATAALATSLHPDTFKNVPFTGKVVVENRFCVTYPCPPGVFVVAADGTKLAVQGPLMRDVEAFVGQEVTIKGERYNVSIDFQAGMKVNEFAPGKSSTFISGKLVNLTNCAPNERCMPKVGITKWNGDVLPIEGEIVPQLANLVGATVTLRGNENAERLKLYKHTNVMIKGTLEAAFHIMSVPEPGQEFATHFLNYTEGASFPIFGASFNDRNERLVWVSGKYAKDYQGADIFRASKASRGLWTDEPAVVVDGLAVDRDADTQGAVAKGSTGAGATGGGATR